MNSLNQVIIEGNVVRQPEKKTCKNGASFCRIPIAVNRYYKNTNGEYVDDVSFFDISTFGSLSETCEKWCLKGRGIRVVGRLKQNVTTDENGKKNSRVDIIAEHIEFKPVLKKSGDKETEEAGAESAPKASASKKEKLAMLAEVAAATQKEQEDAVEEEAVF
ncbi:single-stranded DNA-binding protein [Treponema sp.]|uniref:single-stranded DNA-binding protein n=1 Tax=Treponema sp. TaxID=166 RepID=UPI003890192D